MRFNEWDKARTTGMDFTFEGELIQALHATPLYTLTAVGTHRINGCLSYIYISTAFYVLLEQIPPFSNEFPSQILAIL